jgi:hypothetical protein
VFFSFRVFVFRIFTGLLRYAHFGLDASSPRWYSLSFNHRLSGPRHDIAGSVAGGCMRRGCVLLLLMLLGGCSRQWYRLSADKECYGIVDERRDEAVWPIANDSIDPPPASRLLYGGSTPTGIPAAISRPL